MGMGLKQTFALISIPRRIVLTSLVSKKRLYKLYRSINVDVLPISQCQPLYFPGHEQE